MSSAKWKHDLRFESLHEFVQWLDSTEDAKGAGYESHKPGRYRWDFDLGWDGAYQYATGAEIWEEGTEKLSQGVATAQHTERREVSAMPVLEQDVCGIMPNVPAMLSGVPNHMMAVAFPPQPTEVVTIGFGGFSAGCESENMLNRGIALLCMVDALERSGKRCEIWYDDGFPGTGASRVRVLLKAASAHWNPHSLAFAMAHPAFFRRLGFAWMEKLECCNKHTNAGYAARYTSDDFTFNYGYCTDDYPYSTLHSSLRTMERDAAEQGFEINLTGQE